MLFSGQFHLHISTLFPPHLQEYLQTCPVTRELLDTEGTLSKIMHFLTTTAIPELNLAINLSDFPSNLKSLLFNIFQEIPRIHHASKTILNMVKSPKFVLSHFQDKETQISQILRIYREFMIRQTELYGRMRERKKNCETTL